MPNNIINLQEAIAQRNKENAAMAAEQFAQPELTPEEEAKLKEMESRHETVVTETSPEGVTTSVPVDTFLEGVDKELKAIKSSSGDIIAKGLNVGDIKKTAEEMKRDAQKQAIKAFRDMAADADTDREYTDEEIVAINNQAISAIQAYLKVDRLESSDIIKAFRKLTMRQIADIVPNEFIEIYATQAEIRANNFRAKERLISTLAYLSVTGPEMDYLNEYIDREHKLMMVSHRIVDCQMSIADMLTSKDTLAEIVKKAMELAPVNPESPWTKYIKGSPQKVHNEFAQQAVVTSMIKEAYEKLLEEYKDDPDCAAQIQEQIDESNMKYQVYTGILDLVVMREVWDILVDRLKADKRGSYKNLQREAIAAMDRIRRAKQNVSFPIYSEGNPGNSKPEILFNMYMAQYPTLLASCNETINAVWEKDQFNMVGKEYIVPLEIEGIPNEAVHEMFAMLLLITFGRIMKKLSPVEQTKYQAIELDLYFTMYCKLVTDVYVMNKVWTMMKDFVEYAIKAWPNTGKKVKK